jgi:hypothetical protein
VKKPPPQKKKEDHPEGEGISTTKSFISVLSMAFLQVILQDICQHATDYYAQHAICNKD